MAALRAVAAAGRWVQRYRLSIWVVVFTTLAVTAGLEARFAIDRIDRLVVREAAEDVIEDAQGCVNAWERTDGSRAAIHASVTGVVTLAFNVSGPDLSEERRTEISAAATPIIRDAQQQIPDPPCDRDRALERLEEGAP